MADPRRMQGLSELLGVGMQIMAHTIFSKMSHSQQLVDRLAVEMARAEDPEMSWEELPKGDRLLWRHRAKSAIESLILIFKP